MKIEKSTINGLNNCKDIIWTESIQYMFRNFAMIFPDLNAGVQL